MKIQKLFLPLLILSMFFAGTVVQAQSESEKEKEEKIIELEKKLQQALKEREAELEKALKESKKFQNEELKKILEDQKKVDRKAMEQYRRAWDLSEDDRSGHWQDARDYYDQKYLDRSHKNYQFRVYPPDVDIDYDFETFEGLGNVYFSSSLKDQTALTVSKELDEVSGDTKFKYELTEGAKGINFKVDGSMNEGTLLIKLIKPGGEALQEIEISPLADVSWNQDVRWSEEEELEGNIGTWVIVVSAKGASGRYSVNVRAN